jgi:hypothetical protein
MFVSLQMLDSIGEQWGLREDQSQSSASLDEVAGITSVNYHRLVTGVSISIRPNLLVVYACHTAICADILAGHSYLISVWLHSTLKAHNPCATSLEGIHAIGRHFKVKVLQQSLHISMMKGGGGYRSEVEFMPHKTGMRKKGQQSLTDCSFITDRIERQAYPLNQSAEQKQGDRYYREVAKHL